MTPRWTRVANMLAKCQLLVAICGSDIAQNIHACSRNLERALCSRARADLGGMVRNKISYKISYNISKIIALLFHYVHVNMPRRFSHLSLLRRRLPDAPYKFSLREGVRVHTFAKSPTSVQYACGAAIIRPTSGFLKSILRSDFVCFKFLIGTSVRRGVQGSDRHLHPYSKEYY